MRFDTDEVERIASEACALFGLQIVCDEARANDPHAAFACSIMITGGWAGSVGMGCSPVFAARLASMIFEIEPDEVSDDDVKDAFGELVNVAAGNIKALLPSGCVMGLPQVSTDVQLVTVDTSRVQVWGFSSEGDRLTVVINKAA